MTQPTYTESRCDRGLILGNANLRCQRVHLHFGLHKHEGTGTEQSGYHTDSGNGFLDGARFVVEWEDVAWRLPT